MVDLAAVVVPTNNLETGLVPVNRAPVTTLLDVPTVSDAKHLVRKGSAAVRVHLRQDLETGRVLKLLVAIQTLLSALSAIDAKLHALMAVAILKPQDVEVSVVGEVSEVVTGVLAVDLDRPTEDRLAEGEEDRLVTEVTEEAGVGVAEALLLVALLSMHLPLVQGKTKR